MKGNKNRPHIMMGETIQLITGCGQMYVTINENDKGVISEIFTRLGKAGGCTMAQNETIGRLASLASRLGATPEELIKQLCGIKCHRPPSCSDAILQAIKQFVGGKKDGN